MPSSLLLGRVDADGFDTGQDLRAQRQARLQQSFGFMCRCAKCQLTGGALAESELRLAAVGQPLGLPAPPELLASDAAVLLTQLGHRFSLLEKECAPHSYVAYHGVEHILMGFVELCDAAAAQLFDVLRRCPPAATAAASASMGDRGAAATSAAGATAAYVVAAGGRRVRVDALRDSRGTYLRAARHWAELALRTTRVLEGEDSPAHKVWSAVLDKCWGGQGGEALKVAGSESGGGHGGCGVVRAENTMESTFQALWREAGMSRSDAPEGSPTTQPAGTPLKMRHGGAGG